MSDTYKLACVTCPPETEEFGVGDGFRNPEAMERVIPHLALFAQVARAGFQVDPDCLEFYGSEPPYNLASWALRHEGHNIVLRNEFGDTIVHVPGEN